MQLTRHATVRHFLRHAQGPLERREAEHSLILGVALAAERSGAPPGAEPYLATVHDGDELVAAAFRTPPHPLLLASLAPSKGAAGLIVDDLVRSGAGEGPVLAPDPLAHELAHSWLRATGTSPRLRMRQRLHALSAVSEVPAAPGHLRQAGDEDRGTVARWMEEFDRETIRAGLPAGAGKAADRRIDAGEIVIWNDPEPRAMAGHARPTRGTISINAVYTPPEHRGRGYATACVAELSRRLLGKFRQCVLFTDLANPTSNAIYERIGYRPLLDLSFLDLGAGTPPEA